MIQALGVTSEGPVAPGKKLALVTLAVQLVLATALAAENLGLFALMAMPFIGIACLPAGAHDALGSATVQGCQASLLHSRRTLLHRRDSMLCHIGKMGHDASIRQVTPVNSFMPRPPRGPGLGLASLGGPAWVRR